MTHVSGTVRALMPALMPALLIALLIALAGAVPAQADGGVPLPKPAKAFSGEKCVEPVSVMRRFHMSFLEHQRDDTVHGGIRGAKHSLKGCVDCHAVKSPDVAGGKVRTLKPFCQECHDYAAVSIDCFGCHTGAAK